MAMKTEVPSHGRRRDDEESSRVTVGVGTMKNPRGRERHALVFCDISPQAGDVSSWVKNYRIGRENNKKHHTLVNLNRTLVKEGWNTSKYYECLRDTELYLNVEVKRANTVFLH